MLVRHSPSAEAAARGQAQQLVLHIALVTGGGKVQRTHPAKNKTNERVSDGLMKWAPNGDLTPFRKKVKGHRQNLCRLAGIAMVCDIGARKIANCWKNLNQIFVRKTN